MLPLIAPIARGLPCRTANLTIVNVPEKLPPPSTDPVTTDPVTGTVSLPLRWDQRVSSARDAVAKTRDRAMTRADAATLWDMTSPFFTQSGGDTDHPQRAPLCKRNANQRRHSGRGSNCRG